MLKGGPCSSEFSRVQKISAWLLLLVVTVSFFNAILRASPESISLYRVLFPLQFLLISLLSFRDFKSYSIFSAFLLVFILLSFLISTYSFNQYNYIFLAHYITIFLFYPTVLALYRYFALSGMYRFLTVLFVVFVVIGFLDVAGLAMPNVDPVPYAIRGHMTVENDYSLVLAAYFFITILASRSSAWKLFVFLFVVVLSFYNDAKIIVLGVFPFGVVYFLLNNKFFPFKVKLVFFIAMMAPVFLGLYWVSSFEITFPGRSYTLVELLADPVFRIFTLSPYGMEFGSIANRTDMIIFALRDFISSNFMGVGLGNTLMMLETERYGRIGSAKSLHNFPLQFMAECGAVVTFFSCYVLFRRLGFNYFLALVFMLFSSLSQSVGLFSNYYYFFCMYFIAALGRDCSKDKATWALSSVSVQQTPSNKYSSPSLS